MTPSALPLSSGRPRPRSRRAVRRDPLLVALLLGAAAGVAALAVALAARAAAPPAPAGGPRVALVADAGPRSGATLARATRTATAARDRGADVAVRLPRTRSEAAADVRYLAAGGYRRVVTVGPLARAAARAAAPDFPRTAFVARAAVPGELR
jgi:basic membrane lipoprotein Med (substrate-binding protein (PBP1-ABC) superfamily)